MKGFLVTRSGPALLGLVLTAGIFPATASAQIWQGTQRIERVNPGTSYLGIEMREVSADNVATYKLNAERGVIVSNVQKGSPAAEANIQEKDVIVDYEGIPVSSTMQLSRLVQETPAGRRVNLVVSRDGKKLNLTAKITRREGPLFSRGESFRSQPEVEREFEFGPGGRMFRFRIPDSRGGFGFPLPPGGESRQARPQLGVTLQGLTDQMADFLGVPGKRGALVTSVREGSPAAAAKLKAGDVIVGAGDRTIDEPEDLARAVEARPGEKLDLLVIRDKKEVAVTVELPKDSRATRGFRL